MERKEGLVANSHCLLSEVGIGADCPEWIRKPFLPPPSLRCPRVPRSVFPRGLHVSEALPSARIHRAPRLLFIVSFNHSLEKEAWRAEVSCPKLLA